MITVVGSVRVSVSQYLSSRMSNRATNEQADEGLGQFPRISIVFTRAGMWGMQKGFCTLLSIV